VYFTPSRETRPGVPSSSSWSTISGRSQSASAPALGRRPRWTCFRRAREARPGVGARRLAELVRRNGVPTGGRPCRAGRGRATDLAVAPAARAPARVRQRRAAEDEVHRQQQRRRRPSGRRAAGPHPWPVRSVQHDPGAGLDVLVDA
jgi:hypothetical protein